MNVPIRLRLTAWYVALLAMILLALGGFLLVRLRADLVRATDQALSIRAAQISLGLRSGCEGEFRDVSGVLSKGLSSGEVGAQLVDPTGAVVESSGDAIANAALLSRTELTPVFSGSDTRRTVAIGPDAESFRVLAVRLSASGCLDAIVVAASLDDVQRSVHRLLVLLLIAGPAVVALAAAGGWALAGRGLGPVSDMTREARELGTADLSGRIRVPATSDELQRLAETLNDLLSRAQASLDEQHRFVADASHELRTPLAVMLTELDVSLRSPTLDQGSRDVLVSTREEVERVRLIVEGLLTLARIDEGSLSLAREQVSLAHAAANAITSLSALSAAARVTFALEAEVPAIVVGDPSRLDQVLTNLLANAVAFSPPGSVVQVRTWEEGGDAGVTVRDHGPGLDVAMLPRIFDRFVRGEGARTSEGGGGLGLAICREIVRAHGGRIWADSRLGEGSTFSFAIPGRLPPGGANG
ncbi:MAG: HAMP domain-containing sensor histidine kinase [Actinomycetota bacterium]